METARKKYIFLDVDGVLWSTRANVGLLQKVPGNRNFDPIAIGLINQLSATHHAEIVLISTRAQSEAILEYLRSAGLTAPFAEDWRIDDPTASDRTPSIQRYCDAHEIKSENYIIVDDEAAPKLKPHYQKRWVNPNLYNGFLYEDYLRADAMLANRELEKDELSVVDHIEGNVWGRSK